MDFRISYEMIYALEILPLSEIIDGMIYLHSTTPVHSLPPLKN
jgi:hypothetical protein